MKFSMNWENYFAAAAAVVLLTALPVRSQEGASDTDSPRRPSPPVGPLLHPKSYEHPDVDKSVPRDPFGHPDLTGWWQPDRRDQPVGNIGKDLPGFELPYTEAGKQAHQHNLTVTPDPEGVCLPSGLPRQSASGLGFGILQTRELIGFLYHQNNYRVVFLDGRKHPEDPDPQYFGHDTGRWEGDTLVVDAVGFKDSMTSVTWADENGDAHSDELHVVEHWTRVDATHLVHESAIDDPKYFAYPFKYHRVYNLAAPGAKTFYEYICDENNLDRDHLTPGPGPIRADGTRGYDSPTRLPDNPPGPEAYGK